MYTRAKVKGSLVLPLCHLGGVVLCNTHIFLDLAPRDGKIWAPALLDTFTSTAQERARYLFSTAGWLDRTPVGDFDTRTYHDRLVH